MRFSYIDFSIDISIGRVEMVKKYRARVVENIDIIRVCSPLADEMHLYLFLFCFNIFQRAKFQNW